MPDPGRGSAPSVSVVIPAYNAKATLGATLRSVQRQTLSDIEILVVDDGSQDGTDAVAAAAAASDRRVRLIRQENAGVAAARNAGAREARSDLLAFIDADDLWRPRKLELQTQLLHQRGAQVGLVYTWHCVINAGDVILRWSRRERVEGRVLRELLHRNLVGNGSAALVRRAAFEDAGGYDVGLRGQGAQGCEDLKFYLGVAERWEFAVVPDHLTGYRLVAGSMSDDYARMLKSHALVLDAYRGSHPQWGELIDDHERLFREWLLAKALREGSWTWAGRLLALLLERRKRTTVSAVTRMIADPLLYAPRLLFRSGLGWREVFDPGARRFLRGDDAEAPGA